LKHKVVKNITIEKNVTILMMDGGGVLKLVKLFFEDHHPRINE